SQGKHFIINEEGQTKFDFAVGNKWLDFFKSCHQSGEIFYESECSEISPLFGNDILFAFKVGSWIIQQKHLFPSSPLELFFIPSPPGIKGNYSLISSLGMGIINDAVIHRNALHIAWDFIKKLVCSVDVQRRLVENYFGISINTEIFSEQKSKKEYIPFIQSLSMGTMRSDHPAQHGILKVMRIYFDKVIKGELSVNDACSQIQEIGELQIEIENERFLV
ncbi:MAG TPA: hypothetical protein P5239_10975, partial [Victivallales bacterium]|nr:hypothetical protein [Victivallales bacterium]